MTARHDSGSDERGVIYAGDARAAEAALFAAVAPWVEAAIADPGLLSRPIRIVVPSQTLRAQLSAHLAESFNGAALGVVIQTVRALSSEVASRTQVRMPEGEDAFSLLVERRARNETALSSKLADLEGGGSAVAGTVRDLFDALFQEEQLEPLLELIQEELRGDEAQVAQSICRVAAQVRRDLAEAGSVSLDEHYGEVAEAIRRDAQDAIPHRAIFIHGFADATEAVTMLLGSLRDHAGATVILELPRDPSAPDAPEASSRYAAKFGERLGLPQLDDAGLAAAATGSPQAAKIELRCAPDQDAEVRAVCEKVFEAAQRGVPFEQIAIVARSLEVRKRALRRQLDALGIPFGTAQKARGSVGNPERRARAFADLLAGGADCSIDPLFVARARDDETDLLLAVRSLGAGRLCDVPPLNFESQLGKDGSLALPNRRGFSASSSDTTPGEDDGDASAQGGGTVEAESEPPELERDSGKAGAQAPRAERRRIEGDLLRHWVRDVEALLGAMDSWPDEAGFQEWSQLVTRCADTLAPDTLAPNTLASGEVETGEALSSLVSRVLNDIDLRAEFHLRRDEFIHLFSSRTHSTVFDPLGQTGAGVRVLDATQARGLTFRELHLIAVERDIFPRTPAEDPLLRDVARRRLRELLPGLPLKRESGMEERYLFAQACGCAEHVTVSYAQVADARGSTRAPSPFYQRLERVSAERIQRSEFPPLLSVQASPHGTIDRPMREWAVLQGLAEDRSAALTALPSVQATAMSIAPSAAEHAASGRAHALIALDPGHGINSLGPFLGRVGSPAKDDPRTATSFFVTHFEGLARCSWQAFLEKTLRVERVPDPLEALPVLEPWMVGKTLHGALEKLVEQALSKIGPLSEVLPKTLEAALDGRTGAPWAAPATEEKRLILLRKVASEVLREEGITWEGLALPLAQRTLPYLDEVCRLELDPIGAKVLATEIEGELTLDTQSPEGTLPLTLLFRADEVRRDDTGSVILIDWKTSQPIDKGKGLATRERHHKFAVAKGTSLQTIAYAQAARELGEARASGVYVYLKPEAPDHARIFPAQVEGENFAEFKTAFDDVISTLAQGLRLGGLPPRLFDHGKERQEGAACKWCRVSEACLRGDSGARRRLASFVEQTGLEDSALSPDVATARKIMDLNRKGRLDPPKDESASTASGEARKVKS